MVDPYKMILLNLTASLLLLFGIIFYKFVYPKKSVNLLFLLIVLSFLPLISIFRKGTYESGDLSLHVKIAMSFYESLQDGNIIPRWANIVCYGYGCPQFVFMYPLPYYIISLFHFLGFSFIFSVKLLLISSFLASGIAIYFWIKDLFGKIPAFVSALFYLFAPYHLIDMHFRVSIGEMLAFVFLPLIFLSTNKLIKIKNYKWFFINGFLFFLLILAHQAIVLASLFLFLSYGFFFLFKNSLKVKSLVLYIISFIYGILLSSFYSLPVIFESRYTHWNNYMDVAFPNMTDFLYSPYRYGFLFQGPKGELSFLIGYIQLIIIIISVYLIIYRKIKNKQFLLFFTILFFLYLLMMQSITKSIWNNIVFLKSFQFSYRLLVFLVFSVSVLAAVIVQNIKNKSFIFVVCFIAVFSTTLNWGNRKVIPEINDNYLKNEMFKENSLGGNPLNPKWVNLNLPWTKTLPKSSIEVLSGKANITQFKRNSTEHGYFIDAKTQVLIKENTFYFPGWALNVDGQNHPIDFEYSKYPGVITFNLEKGLHRVELLFLDTPVRKISKFISLSILFLSFLYLIRSILFPKIKIKF